MHSDKTQDLKNTWKDVRRIELCLETTLEKQQNEYVTNYCQVGL